MSEAGKRRAAATRIRQDFAFPDSQGKRSPVHRRLIEPRERSRAERKVPSLHWRKQVGCQQYSRRLEKTVKSLSAKTIRPEIAAFQKDLKAEQARIASKMCGTFGLLLGTSFDPEQRRQRRETMQRRRRWLRL